MACSDIMNRVDLLPLAQTFAGKVYQGICDKVPFEELQEATAELAVSTSTRAYDLTDTGVIATEPSIAGIISIRMTYATGFVRRLKKSHHRAFEQLAPNLTGRPYRYARYKKTIEFDRIPDTSTYTWRIRYWKRPVMETNIGDTNLVTPPAWDELMWWETVHRLYSATDQHDKALALMMPQQLPRQPSPQRTRIHEVGLIPRLWNDLLRTLQANEAADDDFGINPMFRGYTSGAAR